MIITRTSAVGILAVVGGAIGGGVLVTLLGANSAEFAVLLIPIACLAVYLAFRFPALLAVALAVAWCTAPAFEWIELGNIGGFTIRPDYVAIALMLILLVISPRVNLAGTHSFWELRWGILALVLAEIVSLVVDVLVTGDVRLMLLLLVKTLGAAVAYLFIRSRLSRQHLVAGLGVFIGLAIIPVVASIAVGITHSSDLFDLLLKGSATQDAYSTPFGTVPRAFLFGAEPYLLAVFATCLAILMGRGMALRFRFWAFAMVLLLLLRLPFTWYRNLIATYAAIFVLAVVAGWWLPWLRLNWKAQLSLLGLAAILIPIGSALVPAVPEFQTALDFTLERFATLPTDVASQTSGARFVGASLAIDDLLSDPTALLFGFSSRVTTIGLSAIPTFDIATPVGIWLKFGFFGFVAAVYLSVAGFRAGWRERTGNRLTQLVACSILLTLGGFWFQTMISGSPFTMTPYATILVLGILFAFFEIARREIPDEPTSAEVNLQPPFAALKAGTGEVV